MQRGEGGGGHSPPGVESPGSGVPGTSFPSFPGSQLLAAAAQSSLLASAPTVPPREALLNLGSEVPPLT